MAEANADCEVCLFLWVFKGKRRKMKRVFRLSLFQTARLVPNTPILPIPRKRLNELVTFTASVQIGGALAILCLFVHLSKNLGPEGRQRLCGPGHKAERECFCCRRSHFRRRSGSLQHYSQQCIREDVYFLSRGLTFSNRRLRITWNCPQLFVSPMATEPGVACVPAT